MKDKVLFCGKKILITGHTGFKGSWLAVWLNYLGANVVGVSLEPPSNPSHFEVSNIGESIEDHRLDIRNAKALKKLISDFIQDSQL